MNRGSESPSSEMVRLQDRTRGPLRPDAGRRSPKRAIVGSCSPAGTPRNHVITLSNSPASVSRWLDPAVPRRPGTAYGPIRSTSTVKLHAFVFGLTYS